MLHDVLELTFSFIVALFLVPLCRDFILVWVLAVVCIVLQINFCLYMSPFSSFQGSSFQFQCMYAPPHPVKKCIVFYVRELLYYVDPSVGHVSSDVPFQNIVQRPV